MIPSTKVVSLGQPMPPIEPTITLSQVAIQPDLVHNHSLRCCDFNADVTRSLDICVHFGTIRFKLQHTATVAGGVLVATPRLTQQVLLLYIHRQPF